MQTVTFDNLKIQKCNDDAFYISIDGLTVYIDVSIDGEKYISHWLETENVNDDDIHCHIY